MARKERTFDGCWTCRSRKVKCDLTKPICMRCAKSKRECLGYAIRLRWSDPVTISKDKSMTSLKQEDNELDNMQRRNVDLMVFPQDMLYETYAELNSILEKVDDSAIVSGQAKMGPFRCFRFANVSHGDGGIESKQQENVSSVVPLASPPTSPSPVQQTPPPPKRRRVTTTTMSKNSIFSKTNNSHVHYELLNFAKLTILAIKGPDYKFNDQNMLHILYPKFFPNIDSDDAWFANATMVNSKLYTRKGNELTLYPLFRNLLDHFTPDLFSVNRIGLKDNYFHVLVIPYIKQIVGQFICWDFAFWDVNDLQELDELDDKQLLQSIKLCIIYLCLGLSAFKVSGRTTLHEKNEDDEYKIDEHLKISIELRKLGIKLLNYHLDESDVIAERQKGDKAVEDYDTMLLLALLLQIELDCMFSVFENLDLIYAIGDFVIKNKLETRTRNSTMNKFLINTFKIKYFFYESTQAINLFNYQMEKEDELRYKDLNEDYNLIDDLDSAEDDEEDDESPTDTRFTPSIENLLSAREPAKLDYAPTAFTINFNNNRQYSAAYEVTGDSSESSIPRMKFAPPVEDARRLGLNYKPMFWNLLMAGSVATDNSTQERIKEIWQTCPGFESQSNYWRAKQILYEIWKRRASGEEEEANLGFMNLIREWDIALSLG
ncbi:Arginine metabolism regulation protein II [Candida parapsilosis]|nr:Arginine metabolism regulation protein II [Candida parapsilosis]KAI5911049.1 Arginine metabolism regulation protein II [Candida parapsilosis]